MPKQPTSKRDKWFRLDDNRYAKKISLKTYVLLTIRPIADGKYYAVYRDADFSAFTREERDLLDKQFLEGNDRIVALRALFIMEETSRYEWEAEFDSLEELKKDLAASVGFPVETLTIEALQLQKE